MKLPIGFDLKYKCKVSRALRLSQALPGMTVWEEQHLRTDPTVWTVYHTDNGWSRMWLSGHEPEIEGVEAGSYDEHGNPIYRLQSGNEFVPVYDEMSDENT